MVNRSDELDVNLKTADKPFDDISELLRDLGMDPRLPDNVTARVRTTPIARISEDAKLSNIVNGKARVHVRIAAAIDHKTVKIGWRCLSDGDLQSRGSFVLDDTEWRDEKIELGHVRSGTFELSVPPRASLQCFLSYEGLLQHEFWIHDSDPRGNVRWCYHALAERANKPGWLELELSSAGDQNHFEDAVACLFGLLGFRTTHYVKPLDDGADIVATTDDGNVLLIECCSKTSRAEKVEKLVDRYEKLLHEIENQEIDDARIVPVMVVREKKVAAKTSAERGSDRGVITLDEDDLRSYIEHSKSRADAHLEIFEKLAAQMADLKRPKDASSLFTLADPPR